jgi:hypothetical protein
MGISIDEINMLFASLEAAGWQRDNDRIIAPLGTMWLDYHDLWFFGTARHMQERMRGRLDRIVANRNTYGNIDQESWQRSYDDTFSLIRCLQSVFG